MTAIREKLLTEFEIRKTKKQKNVTVIKGIYPSDQKNFKRGVGVCALKHHKIWGYYMDRIHTAKDTVLEEENIAILRDGAVRLVDSLTN